MTDLIIDKATRTIRIGSRFTKLLMGYICPFDNRPLILYWKTDSITQEAVLDALGETGHRRYKRFETDEGIGIDYYPDKDNKNIHAEHSKTSKIDNEYYSYILYKVLNLHINLNKMLNRMLNPELIDSDIEDTPHTAMKFYITPENARIFIDKVRNQPNWVVVDELVGRGDPIFFFSTGNVIKEWGLTKEQKLQHFIDYFTQFAPLDRKLLEESLRLVTEEGD